MITLRGWQFGTVVGATWGTAAFVTSRGIGWWELAAGVAYGLLIALVVAVAVRPRTRAPEGRQ